MRVLSLVSKFFTLYICMYTGDIKWLTSSKGLSLPDHSALVMHILI